MTDFVIQTNNLTKKFKNFLAVDKLNLNIRQGEIYGFLGPNGAGKTTTLLMLIGVVPPTEGEFKIFGKRMSEGAFDIKKKIGMITEYQKYYDEMTAWEYLSFFARLYKIDKFEPRAEYLLRSLDLWKWKDALIRNYSTGMNRKIGFIRALLHSPELIILDEPVSGLDPKGILQIRKILQEENQQGKTILISSHILSEIENTADRVGILVNGKLVIEDCITNLHRLGNTFNKVEVELLNNSPHFVDQLQLLSFVKKIEHKGNLITIFTPNDRDYRDQIGLFLAEKDAIILGLKTIETSLEDAYVTITEKVVQEWIN
ncbi:MAG: Fluoroquinolones export ATP-binding protein [Firmicutes bacterium ADurb.Bin419]|jgi:ABC-type multidrug transport system ATPase subunit|nr:MAG: Fluoroquinolones export ATP-binding protein [Firmicutes bacterium ADurb.Bin419]